MLDYFLEQSYNWAQYFSKDVRSIMNNSCKEKKLKDKPLTTLVDDY